MPTPFAVTTASNSVFLDTDRTGTAQFTVSNQSGRSVEGRAQLVTDDPEAASWISLRGPAHRAFATAGTEQYTVEIDVPPDAPSGNYTLRLDVVGEERPDEQYVEGPSVTFQVPEPEPAPAPFPWTIVAAIAAVVLIGGGGLAFGVFFGDDEGNTAPVPDVSGLTPSQATDSLREVGFRLWDLREEHNDSVPPNRVIRTVPKAGTQAVTDSAVALRVSLGPSLVTIPPVENVPIMDAITRLNENGLIPTVVTFQYHSRVPREHAIRTNPDAGGEVPETTDLTLIVSAGPKPAGVGPKPKLGEWKMELPQLKMNVQPGQKIPKAIIDSLQKNLSNP
jgi:hypothetical protein